MPPTFLSSATRIYNQSAVEGEHGTLVYREVKVIINHCFDTSTHLFLLEVVDMSKGHASNCITAARAIVFRLCHAAWEFFCGAPLIKSFDCSFEDEQHGADPSRSFALRPASLILIGGWRVLGVCCDVQAWVFGSNLSQR